MIKERRLSRCIYYRKRSRVSTRVKQRLLHDVSTTICVVVTLHQCLESGKSCYVVRDGMPSRERDHQLWTLADQLLGLMVHPAGHLINSPPQSSW